MIDYKEMKKIIERSNNCQELSFDQKPPIPELKNDQRYVFISYAHEDYKSVYSDLLELHKAGIRYWYDMDLKAGKSWNDEVKEKMESENCIGVIFYLSESFVLSKSIEEEVQCVLGKGGIKGKNFFTVNLSDELPGDLIRCTLGSKKRSELLQYDIVDVRAHEDILLEAFPDENTCIVKNKERNTAHISKLISDIQLNFAVKKKAPVITKIVLTGGPCAGKSTAMSWIQNHFVKQGYSVLFVPETATELISGGVAPWTCGSNGEYQYCQMQLQIAKEEIFRRAAETMSAEKILIVCDRGTLDNKAYMLRSEFDAVLKDLQSNEVELRDQYDAVFHLETAAKNAVEYYTTANNAVRKETPEEAIAIDDRLIAAWTGHPHFRVIDNSTDFELKMRRLITEIAALLGEPEPFEIERKFLIEYPDLARLEADPCCERVEIIQTYLTSAPHEEVRVRQRGVDGNYVYTKTVKRTVTALKRVEIEKRLTQSEYLTLLLNADIGKR